MAKIPKELVKELLRKTTRPSSDLVTYKWDESTRDLRIITIAEKPTNLGYSTEAAIEFEASGWDGVFELEVRLVQEFDFANNTRLDLEPLDSPEGFMVRRHRNGLLYERWVPTSTSRSPLGFDGKVCLCDGDGIYVLRIEMPRGPVNIFLLGKDVG